MNYVDNIMALNKAMKNPDNKKYIEKYYKSHHDKSKKEESKYPELAALMDDAELAYLGLFKDPRGIQNKIKNTDTLEVYRKPV
jgi:hypothetical protein